MTSGQEFSRYQKGIVNRYYEHIDTISLQKLGEIVSELYLTEGSKATKLWNSARQALAKLAPADDPHVMKVLSVRSVEGLAKLVTQLNAQSSRDSAVRASASVADDEPADAVIDTMHAPPPQRVVVTHHPTSDPATSGTGPTSDELKRALKAFRKRLKLTRLDDESRLGRSGNPMSGGRQSQVQAIMPPREFSTAVWEELVRQGKLKSAGGSFYQLVEGV